MYTPDYLRCGSAVYFITWSRLFIAAIAAAIVLLMFSAYQEAALLSGTTPSASTSSSSSSSSPSDADESWSLLGGASASGGKLRATEGSASSSGGTRGGPRGSNAKTASTSSSSIQLLASGEIMKSWCTMKVNTYYLSKWKLACLGCDILPAGSTIPTADGTGTSTRWPSDNGEDEKAYCDWLGATNTEVKFRMCTFDRTIDTQISTYLHKEGHWNGWKKEIIEQMLPRIRDGMDAPDGILQGRTLVIDVGSNVGFFTLLASTRGYDVFSIEPSRDAVIRQLFSLYGNGIRVAKSPSDTASRAGAIRKPIVYVMQNAGSDAYGNANLEFVKDNPGASWIVAAGVTTNNAQAVTTIYLDDLLVYSTASSSVGNKKTMVGGGGGGGKRKGDSDQQQGGVTASSGTAPAIDPFKVRLIKISAEGMDSRVLHGMRRLLSLGKIPFVIFVYNDAHVKNQGCDPARLIHSLLEGGYRLWHAGTWFKRPIDVERFIKGMTTRSIELLFVGAETTWY